jgi:hypothetical protein
VSGYVPLFDSVLDGTLFGKWPHTGIWTCLLSQVDQHGEIDMHPNLLAAKIGVPADLLMSCISDFMKPDPGSRTKDHDGRRLELIDADSRDWGWRVINHAKYREKARLKAKAQREVESGENAKRMNDRRSPPETAADPLSSHLNSTHLNSDTTQRSAEDDRAAPTTSVGKQPTPEAEMAIALRDLGVNVRSIDPVLIAWIRDKFTTQQAIDAVGIARIRKPHPEAIHANYLDKILRQPIRPPPASVKAVDRITWRPPPDDEPACTQPNTTPSSKH